MQKQYALRAFHTFLAPKDYSAKFYNFEIFTAVLSALEWKKNNGSIRLVTNKAGLKLFQQTHIDVVYDDIEDDLDALMPEDIDIETFWAGCKVAALSAQQTPCVMLDLDLVVWKHWSVESFANAISVIHQEPVNNCLYPQQDYFHLKNWQWPDLD